MVSLLRPDPLNRLKLGSHLVAPGHKQGPGPIALAKQRQTLVKLRDQRTDLGLGHARLRCADQPPGLHAHAPSLIDRAGATL